MKRIYPLMSFEFTETQDNYNTLKDIIVLDDKDEYLKQIKLYTDLIRNLILTSEDSELIELSNNYIGFSLRPDNTVAVIIFDHKKVTEDSYKKVKFEKRKKGYRPYIEIEE